MQIFGIGTDITECDRIDRMIKAHGQTFLHRVYTPGEIDYCNKRKQAIQHFTGRWSAKEAVLKALGTGWISGIAWRDIEILNEISGKPKIFLHAGTLDIANQFGIRDIQITISHCNTHAVAFAIAISD